MTDLAALDWFPKRFSEGDMDGAGAKRLLGVPHLSKTDVLVRETAQNSWDARGDSDLIDFSIELRTLGPAAVTALRDVVFADGADVTGIADLLDNTSLRVIEIGDRGTAGLDGPVRNDLAFGEQESRNFANLIFNLGAPRDVELGGGTYGFGKTISYIVSSVATVVFWTRCRTEAGLEDRLIVSAIGEAFDLDGYRYTGRHWWGEWSSDRIQPIVGEHAADLARLIFGSTFDAEETGTSMLILDPQLDASTDAEMVEQLRSAILRNLWPKMVPEPGRDRMTISLKHEGSAVELPDPSKDAMVAPFVDCLVAVRARQVDTEPPPTVWPVETYEIRSQRPLRLLGHLALTRRPAGDADGSEGNDSRMHHVALMRTGAELVVKYEEHRALPDTDFRWAAVFKPTQHTDDSFAAAEPPAHDDWVVSGMEDKRKKRDVNVALREIRLRVNEFVLPSPTDRGHSDESVSVASLGNRLAGLLTGLPGTGASSVGPSGNPRKPGRRIPRPVVTPGAISPIDRPGWNVLTVMVGVEDGNVDGEWIEVTAAVGYDGGSGTADVDEWVRSVGWQPENSLDPVIMRPETQREFRIEFREDVALDVDARVVSTS